MAIIAAALYWIIVAIWLGVLACTLYFSRGKTIIFGSARILLAVVAIDTLRDIIENVYFGIYFGSQYGFFDKGVAAVLGQPLLLMLPKIANIFAGCVVLFILLLQWLPNAARERTTLGKLATVDGMTGLLNRQRFLELAEREFERCQRYGRPLSMLMIDIDLFKLVNDRYGHDIGDKVILDIAELCRNISREIDIVARLGGEEFVILLPETSLSDAASLAERLRIAAAENRGSLPDINLVVTVSIGVAECKPAIELADMMKHADIALYEAKRAGRNRVCTYEA